MLPGPAGGGGGPIGYLPSTPAPTALAGGIRGGPPPIIIAPLVPPRPSRGPIRPGTLIPGISKSGFPARSTSRFTWCSLRGLIGPSELNSPPLPGLQLGLTPRWLTDVKLLVSLSAGDRAPGRSSYEFVCGSPPTESGRYWGCPGVRSGGTLRACIWGFGGTGGIVAGSDANRGSTSS